MLTYFVISNAAIWAIWRFHIKHCIATLSFSFRIEKLERFHMTCPQVRVLVRGAGLEDGDGVLQPAAGRGAAAVRVEGRGRHLAARALRPPRRHRAQGRRRDISGEIIYFEVELGK